MVYRRITGCVTAALLAGLLIGCANHNKKLAYIFKDPDLQYYQDFATEIDYSSVFDEHTPDEIRFSQPPVTISSRQRPEIRDMTLAEAIHTALANSKIIRTANTLGSTGNPVFTNPDQVRSIFDPAIQESAFLFAGRGLEAALAAFDPTLTASMVWGREELIQNFASAGGPQSAGGERVTESAIFRSQLRKQFANSGLFTVSHNWNYTGLNSPSSGFGGVLFPSVYQGLLQAEYRQPLLAGGGTEFTRIAGPIAQSFSGITGVNQGVVIARINNDLTLADFETSVRGLLSDVEDLYWQLYLGYRVYHTQVTARNSALRSWREAKAKLDAGGIEGFTPADESQARDQLFATKAATKEARNNILTTEIRLRRLIGLPVHNGEILRPSDEPVRADFVPDWYASLTEALTQRVELRRQKWNIKSLQLQYKAAQSLTRPRLDFVTNYHINGFGDQLFGGSNDNDAAGTAQGLRSAYGSFAQNDQTGYNIGFELTMPLGFRQALSQVRNTELRLNKARAVLVVQEEDIAAELALAFQDMTFYYATAQDNFNRWQAATDRLSKFEAQRSVGTATLDPVLRAQASVADAENAYYQSLVNYSLAIRDFQLRKGTLLAHNNVHLMEGQWTEDGYREALRRAWARSFAFDAPLLDSEPADFVSDGYIGGVELPPPMDDPQMHKDDPQMYEENMNEDPLPPMPLPEAELEKTGGVVRTGFYGTADPWRQDDSYSDLLDDSADRFDEEDRFDESIPRRTLRRSAPIHRRFE